MDYLYKTTHSPEFVTRWKRMVTNLYGYQNQEPFLVVPGITGNRTLSYLPLLNYTDFTTDQTSHLREIAGNRNFQIRSLNPHVREFQPMDTVTMRIPLQGHDTEGVFRKVFSVNLRKQVKKSSREGFAIKQGSGKEMITDFYRVFKGTMKKFGTPVFSEKLFTLIPCYMESVYINVYKDGQPVAAMLLVFDDKIAWCPWSGSDESLLHLRPGHAMFWTGVQEAIARGAWIFDFGRSGYGNQNYLFKSRWSAIPVKIDIQKIDDDNVYDRYSFVSRVYRKVPSVITDRLGPKLCKHLVDL